mmetsp:Transcript_42830/g.83768  ORF Transcript_42830/g.83768 Transcript_42830/m.83768 type:complete len:264 (-) Transcript_42830:146-937(-)|eukprot:CAMPEP_0173410196 /NCGR_PEP_ID=MMETSP1356-20130122/74043_1 /TAXON_ID=77927 ORGANISM="Hemiselmis virescens, Strain PCC157" /NCGR_SAMPLE_ID=MMETSP1356 /ASSEMBLY_ACC=CAM_ASM_000847 /LENGTH=263 /DNA_ID=CAMNT_0014371795 /DNA_START=30 /DNA_END=821 /DNA_ORIENTATION=-
MSELTERKSVRIYPDQDKQDRDNERREKEEREKAKEERRAKKKHQLATAKRKPESRSELELGLEAVPLWLGEVLQWSHALVFVKWFVLRLWLHGLVHSVLTLASCTAVGFLVLDRFKGRNGHGLGTLTNSLFILNIAHGLGEIVWVIATSVRTAWIPHAYVANIVAFFPVAGFLVNTAAASPFLHYLLVIVWELAVLPAAAWVEVNWHNGARQVEVPHLHRFWGFALVAAVVLHRLDPMTFKWRKERLRMDGALKVPWDPVLY